MKSWVSRILFSLGAGFFAAWLTIEAVKVFGGISFCAEHVSGLSIPECLSVGKTFFFTPTSAGP